MVAARLKLIGLRLKVDCIWRIEKLINSVSDSHPSVHDPMKWTHVLTPNCCAIT